MNRASPFQFIVFGVVVLGLYAAFQAGNAIAEGGIGQVLLCIAAAVWILAVLTIRQYWWIPVFVIGIISFSTTLPGFAVDGTDLMVMFGLACLVARLCMGNLKSKPAESNLGLFFYLVAIYIGMHALIYGADNYFNPDTQFKNIAKRYYTLIISLILIWCMDRYANPKGLRPTINLMILCTIFFSITAVTTIVLSSDVPLISGGPIHFGWASAEAAQGYLRVYPLAMMMLALCMKSSVRSDKERMLYSVASIVFVPAIFFGGGRLPVMVTILSVFCWLLIRRQWKKIVLGGWLIGLSLAILFIAGHTMDAKQMQSMPKNFQNIQRALSIFLPADQQNDDETRTEGSNRWHEDLMHGAWNYANEDYRSMIFGKGYKGWDDSIDMNMFTYGAAYESAVRIAIRMGASETMFFSILPILGWIGVVLYYGLMIEILRRNLKVRKLCPEGSLSRSLCEYAFCLLLPTLLASPISGGIPAYDMIGWIIGFIAAEPYLVKAVPRKEISPMIQRNPAAAIAENKYII